MTSLLSQRALLVRPYISVYRAEITDRNASDELAQAKKADRKSVKTSKFLIARYAIDPILETANSMRSFIRRETLPWRWDGVSLLPTDNYFEFMDGWRVLRQTFDGHVRQLVKHWDRHVYQGKLSLGSLARDYEYPDRDHIAMRYSASLECFPVPDAADFRAEVSEAEAEAIREQLQAASDAQLKQTQEYLWEQMSECVNHIVERLTAYQKDPATGKMTGRFHDTLIGNLRGLVDRLSRLNITKDPDIEAMRLQLSASLCPHDPDELRSNDNLRNHVKHEAERISAEMAQFWQSRAA